MRTTRTAPIIISILLAAASVALYWPAINCGFVNYDDPLYVTDNANVQSGLDWAGIKWAFTHPVAYNWHPLTTLSHMLDCQLFGLHPWGHHLINVLLHALNTVLVFLLFRQLTGATWRSAAVALLFGVHPLHVESVAWVAERKDVLSTFFGLLALLFYARYARHPVKIEDGQAKGLPDARHPALRDGNYWLAVFFYLLGLMSKPMLVTWPFVMLLLDYWPLERFQPGRLGALVREKIPFFVLSFAMSIITFLVQKGTGAVMDSQRLPLDARTGNALISYGRYLGKIFWPTDLTVLYPHPGNWPLDQVLLAGGLVAGITALFLVWRRRYPFLLMGWLWFCGTLVPVIGLVQVGEQAMADRYTYIPSLGIFILLTWTAGEFIPRGKWQAVLPWVGGSAAALACVGLTREQLGYWSSSEALFRHALAVTRNNYVAHKTLGDALLTKDQIDDAMHEFQEAIRLRPDYAEAHRDYGIALYQRGQVDRAIDELHQAIRFDPAYPGAYNYLGFILNQNNQPDEAIVEFREAIRLNPDFSDAYNNLGIAFGEKGQTEDAIREFREAIRLQPKDEKAYKNLVVAQRIHDEAEAKIRRYEEIIELKPDDARAHFNLGIVFGMNGRPVEAIREFQEAIRLAPDFAEAHNNLGTTLGQEGRFAEAIQQFQEAVRLKPDYTEARNNLNRVLSMRKASTSQ